MIKLLDLWNHFFGRSSEKKKEDSFDWKNLFEGIRKAAPERDVSEKIEDFKKLLIKHGVELEKTGNNSYEELEWLRIKSFVSKAKDYLRKARRYRDGFYVEYVKKYLEKAGKKPEDIGTSWEELNQLL